MQHLPGTSCRSGICALGTLSDLPYQKKVRKSPSTVNCSYHEQLFNKSDHILSAISIQIVCLSRVEQISMLFLGKITDDIFKLTLNYNTILEFFEFDGFCRHHRSGTILQQKYVCPCKRLPLLYSKIAASHSQNLYRPSEQSIDIWGHACPLRVYDLRSGSMQRILISSLGENGCCFAGLFD